MAEKLLLEALDKHLKKIGHEGDISKVGNDFFAGWNAHEHTKLTNALAQLSDAEAVEIMAQGIAEGRWINSPYYEIGCKTPRPGKANRRDAHYAYRALLKKSLPPQSAPVEGERIVRLEEALAYALPFAAQYVASVWQKGCKKEFCEHASAQYAKAKDALPPDHAAPETPHVKG